jgi:hypothetical protein
MKGHENGGGGGGMNGKTRREPQRKIPQNNEPLIQKDKSFNSLEPNPD